LYSEVLTHASLKTNVTTGQGLCIGSFYSSNSPITYEFGSSTLDLAFTGANLRTGGFISKGPASSMPQGVASARLVSAKIVVEITSAPLNTAGVVRIGYGPKV